MCVYCWLLRKPLQYQDGLWPMATPVSGRPMAYGRHRELCNISWAEGIHLIWTVSNRFSPAAAFILTPNPMAPCAPTQTHTHTPFISQCSKTMLYQRWPARFFRSGEDCSHLHFHFYCRRPLHIARSASGTALPLISHSWQGQQLISLQSAGTVESKISHYNCLHLWKG